MTPRHASHTRRRITAIIIVALACLHPAAARTDASTGIAERTAAQPTTHTHAAPAAAHPIDLIPHDAIVAVRIRSIDAVDRDAAELLQAAQLITLSTFKQALTVIGVNRALDTTRGIAAAVVERTATSTDGQPGPLGRAAALLLIPTTTHTAFTEAMRATPLGGNGISSFTFDSITLYTSAADDRYTAIAPDIETLEQIRFEPGNTSRRHAGLTPTMIDAAGTANIAIYADPLPAATLVNDLAASMPNDAPDAARAAAEALLPLAQQSAAALWTIDPGPRGVRIRGLITPKPITTFAATLALMQQTPTRATEPAAHQPEPTDFSNDPLSGLPTVGWLAAAAINLRDRDTVVGSLLPSVIRVAGQDNPIAGMLADFATSLDDVALVHYNADNDVTAIARARRDRDDAGGATSIAAGRTAVSVDDLTGDDALRRRFNALWPLFAGEDRHEIIVNVRQGVAVLAPTDARVEQVIDATRSAADAPLRRSGIAGERMVRAVRRVLPDRPLIELHVNIQALIDTNQDWIEQRDLNLLNPNRYPPLAAAATVAPGMVELAAFVPAPTVQNLYELRTLLPAFLRQNSPQTDP